MIAVLKGLAARLKQLGRQFLAPGESLSRRVMRAGFWAFALRIAERLLGFARTVVLARLLAPKDFGLFGLALLALSALETFSQTGFEAALIQRKGDIKPYLNTAWTVQIVRSITLAVVLGFGAPAVACFFGEPKAAVLLRVLALGILVKGFTNPGMLLFHKGLEFQRWFFHGLGGTLAGLAVSIYAALMLRDASALAYGLLASNLAGAALSHLLCPYRPNPRFDLQKAKELHAFGRWVYISSILVFLLNNGDDVFVGKLLGAGALGLYQMAYTISNLPATEITNVVAQVTFPAYARLQDNPAALRQAYLRTFRAVAALSLPLSAGIFVFAPDLTLLFLGRRWLEMVPVLQVLTIWGAIRSLGAMTGPLWRAVGKPHVSTVFHLVKLVLLGALIYPLTMRWGLCGVALALAAESTLVHAAGYVVMARTLRCRIGILVTPLLGPAVAAGVMLSAAVVMRRIIDTTSFAGLLAAGMVAVVLCLAVTVLLGPPALAEGPAESTAGPVDAQ